METRQRRHDRAGVLKVLLGRWQERLDAAHKAGDEDAAEQAGRRLEALRGLLAAAKGLRLRHLEE